MDHGLMFSPMLLDTINNEQIWKEHEKKTYFYFARSPMTVDFNPVLQFLHTIQKHTA